MRGGHVHVGRLEILPREHTVLLDGVPLVLTVRELALLSELATHADRVLTREELVTAVTGRRGLGTAGVARVPRASAAA